MAIVYEQSGFTIMGRMELLGVNATQAAVTSMRYWIFTTNSTSIVSGPTALVVSTVINDTLQTLMWTTDKIGYNFRHDVPANLVTDPLLRYDFEYEVTPASGQIVRFTLEEPLGVIPLKSV